MNDLAHYNEACATCGIPRDLHRGPNDPRVELPNSVWGDLNRCREFVRCEPPRAAYGKLETGWNNGNAPPDVLADVAAMIEAMKRNKRYGPWVMYLTDEGLRRMGIDPKQFPALEGYPNVRVVKYEGGRE